MSDKPPKAIFDCNIFFQAFLTPSGPAYECVRLVEERRVRLVVSLEVLAEVRDVLSRPFVVEKFAHVTPAGINAFLDGLAYTGVLWRQVPRVIHYRRDPDDEPYLNLGIAASVDFLETRDLDLLTLATDHSAEAKQLRQLTRNRMRIMSPRKSSGCLHVVARQRSGREVFQG